MNIWNRHAQRLSRLLPLAALLVVLALSSLTLVHCRVVDERVTGVDLTTAAGDCIKQCKVEFQEAMKAERARHKQALKECGEDPICRERENERYRNRVRELEELLRQCRMGCYNEGSGTGGR